MRELFSSPVWDESLKFWHRGPADLYVGEEMNTYKALLEGAPYKSVLDIGGHIGWFTRYSLQKLGAEKVVTVEPFPSSLDVLTRNFGEDRRVTIIGKAAGRDDTSTVSIQVNVKYPGNNRTDRRVRGRPEVRVGTVDFHALLSATRPDLLKIDIEGAEYSLELSPLPDSVKSIAIEYHQYDDEMLEGQRRIHGFFMEEGFNAVKIPVFKRTFRRTTTGVYLR